MDLIGKVTYPGAALVIGAIALSVGCQSLMPAEYASSSTAETSPKALATIATTPSGKELTPAAVSTTVMTMSLKETSPAPLLPPTRSSLPMTGQPATPGPVSPIETLEQAVAAIQVGFPEVKDIKPNLTPTPFGSDVVFAFDEGDYWNIVFYHGTGDCPSGCINGYYWYFTAWRGGQIEKIGEFSRVFDPKTNSYIESGDAHWGMPH